MDLSDFDFQLPADLVAQEPLSERSASRMLVVNRAARTIVDRTFDELPDVLDPSDLLVLNNTRVFPARLIGKSETGARVELFLAKDLGDNRWSALARPAKRLKPERRIFFGEELSAELESREEDGQVVVRFFAEGNFDQMLDAVGITPLPPYIKREEPSSDDRDRYQTVFAETRGAIAAPTAGLHFTPEILDRIEKRGNRIVKLTLHVGYGTFEPVRTEDLSKHRVSPEEFEIGEEAAVEINEAIASGRRVIAVGTTTTRALESAFAHSGRIKAGPGIAGLTITPGYDFRVINGLLTNFHLPKSSLLVLVSTFAGRELIMEAYAHAIAERYRFYSYGDCMLVV